MTARGLRSVPRARRRSAPENPRESAPDAQLQVRVESRVIVVHLVKHDSRRRFVDPDDIELTAAGLVGERVPRVVAGEREKVRKTVGFHLELRDDHKRFQCQVRRTFVVALPALVLPFLIRSAVVEGIATATEVSTIGIAYSLLIGLLIYRGGLTWKSVLPMLLQTAALSGAILFIVDAASAMGWALTQSGFSHDLSKAEVDPRHKREGLLIQSMSELSSDKSSSL